MEVDTDDGVGTKVGIGVTALEELSLVTVVTACSVTIAERVGKVEDSTADSVCETEMGDGPGSEVPGAVLVGVVRRLETEHRRTVSLVGAVGLRQSIGKQVLR